MQQHTTTFFALAEDAAGVDLPQFVNDKADACLGCSILAHGFLRLHCSDCVHDQRVAFSVRCVRSARGTRKHAGNPG